MRNDAVVVATDPGRRRHCCRASGRARPARVHGVARDGLEHLTTATVTGAHPAALPPLQLRKPVDLGDAVYVCGDHRDTPSIQGAMASGARAARAGLHALRQDAARRPTPGAV